jgi:hypothetical protein
MAIEAFLVEAAKSLLVLVGGVLVGRWDKRSNEFRALEKKRMDAAWREIERTKRIVQVLVIRGRDAGWNLADLPTRGSESEEP